MSGRLGEGGQGVVYLGTLAGESYAVKLLHGPVGDERGAFLREVELAKQVARFCTAQVADAGFDEGRPYIVSEYVDGPSLAREVMLAGPRRGGALERLAVGTVTAIAAIHRAGIVHRDFKPQNVLLGPDGPRVIDFGLARALDAAATLTNRSVGTPAYMAPEQITASAVTGAADVFSWGATMCFAANGTAPFGQDSVAPVLHRILTAPPDLGSLDGRLRTLVAACLDKEARNRPTSRDLLLELLGTSEGLPVEVLRSPPPHILHAVPPLRPPSHMPPTGSAGAVPPAGSAGVALPVGSAGAVLPAGSAGVAPPTGPAGGAPPLHPGNAGSEPSVPLAEPEGTGVPGGYRLPISAARPYDQATDPRGETVAGPDADGGSPPGAVRSADGGPVRDAVGAGGPAPGDGGNARAVGGAGWGDGGSTRMAGGAGAGMGGAAYRGSPAGYPVERVPRAPVSPERVGGTPQVSHPAAPRGPHPAAPPGPYAAAPSPGPLSGAPSPGSYSVAPPERRGRRALGRAGLAVGGALMVTAAVLVTLFVPLFREADMQVRAGTPTSAPTAGPAGQENGDQIAKDRPPTRVVDDPPPVSKDPPVRQQVEIAVPAVAGLSRAAAVRALERAGLAAGDVTERDSPREIGQVLASRPAAGAHVAKGSAVALEVSAGVKVPAVAGTRREEAEGAVTGAGLKLGKVSTRCAAEPDGQVLSTDPKAGARVSGGTAVSLVVARHGALVPGVVGQSRDGALTAVRVAGFAPVVRTQVVEDESRHDVAIAQDPAPDACAAPGGRVTITIGAGPSGGPDPTEPDPTEPDPTEPDPTEPDPTEPGPTEPEPTPTRSSAAADPSAEP
ncbi:protein kinase domain-containing protein [Nonomuraea sp. CA-218870]|uniref:serine/threonine protein kinase n=1 Tax=Nonomuraea sp. CA-218870 TaxID=3239998 RepID=UPI003D9481E3